MDETHKNSKRAVAIALGLGIALLFAEFALRIADLPKPVLAGWRATPGDQDALDLNQLGFRGRRIEYSPRDYVVLLVGDSQVESSNVSAEGSPERRLEHHLGQRRGNVRVFSLGASGYGQDQQFLVLQEYFRRFRADLVLVWETPENDVWNNVFPTHWPADGTPKPTFWLDGGELRGPSEAMGETVGPNVRLAALIRSIVSPSRDGRWERYLPPAYEPLRSFDGPVSNLWQSRWDNDIGVMRQENLASEKSHLAILLTPRSPRMLYGLDLTARLLQEMNRLTRSHGGRFLAFRRDLPGHWTINRSPSGEMVFPLNGKFYRTSNGQYSENIDYMNARVDSLLVPVTVEDWKAGDLDPHLNEAAVDQLMRDLAHRLTEILPVIRD